LPQFKYQFASQFIDEKFTEKLLEIMDSQEPRERILAKYILQSIYVKFFKLRSIIRNQIGNIFFV